LLEQSAQLERWALSAVAHDGRRDVVCAIELPVANCRAARSRIALRAALSLLAGSAALATTSDHLPAITWTQSGVVARRDERRRLAHDEVEGLVGRVGAVGPAHPRRPPVATGDGEGDPILRPRRLPGVARRLPGPAVVGDDAPS
jgi:hypothetical protein